MSNANVERPRRAYEAFSRGDLDGSVADADPDLEYITTGIPGVPEVVRGPEGYKEPVADSTRPTAVEAAGLAE